MTDADKFQEAIQLLAEAVNKAIEKRKNLADPRQRRELQDAYERYCCVVEELYGKGDEEG